MSEGAVNGIWIVEAGTQDLETLAPLFDQCRRFYNQSLDLALARRFLSACVKHRNSAIFLALEGEDEDTNALGFTLLYPSLNSALPMHTWIFVWMTPSASTCSDSKIPSNKRRNLIPARLRHRARSETKAFLQPVRSSVNLSACSVESLVVSC